MISSTLLRLVLLVSIAIATAAPAQYTADQPDAPAAAPIPPSTEAKRNAPDKAAAKTPRKDAARPATAADLTVGATISDSKGLEVGYIKSIDPTGVTVATIGGQVKVPADAFGKNSKGLLIGMSKADFDKLVAQAVGG
jgi:hypothetical protein